MPRNFNQFDYKHAVAATAGYVHKIKEILDSEEDRNLLLGTYDYDETFRIRISTPIHDVDIKDLPSPSAKIDSSPSKALPDGHRNTDLESNPSLHYESTSKVGSNGNSNSTSNLGNSLAMSLNAQITNKRLNLLTEPATVKSQISSRKASLGKGSNPPRLRMKTKGKDYLAIRRKQKEDAIRNLKNYEASQSSSSKHSRSLTQNNGHTKTVLINGKEFVIRSNAFNRDPKRLCHIFNKLNSEKQKIKDHEKETNILHEIEQTFAEFENWLQKEKDLIYIKIEEVHLNGRVKRKQHYISREEYQRLHQQKYNMICDVFKKQLSIHPS